MALKGKHILFIAPESFPVNGAEAIVNIKQLEILSNAGCVIDVVSKKRKWTDYPLTELADTGIQLNSLHVLEVDNHLNWESVKLHLLTFFTFGIVYKGAHWAWPALQVCKKLLKQNQYDCVITKSFPSELVGYWIKKNKGIKWVATWNDPYPVEKYPFPYGNGPKAKVFWGAKELVPMMERYPDFHLFPSERLRDYMLQYMDVSLDKTRILPHVTLKFDLQRKRTDLRCLSILHSGNLNYPRDPESFLNALAVFVHENPEAQLKVFFQGVLPDKLKKLIIQLDLVKWVKILPAISYKESIEHLSDYDVALIIEAPCAEGVFLPTKVSDYMQVGKTIWAISPSQGVLHDLYENGNITYFANCQDEESVLNELKLIYEDFLLGKLRKSETPVEYTPKYIETVLSEII